LRAYWGFKKVEMRLYMLQEVFLYSLYIWKTIAIIRPMKNKWKTRFVWELLTVNALGILVDVAFLISCFVFPSIFVEGPPRATAYSIKLKAEFAVLSQIKKLTDIYRQNQMNRFRNLDVENPVEKVPTTDIAPQDLAAGGLGRPMAAISGVPPVRLKSRSEYHLLPEDEDNLYAEALKSISK
jgi:hypothetical protein